MFISFLLLWPFPRSMVETTSYIMLYLTPPTSYHHWLYYHFISPKISPCWMVTPGKRLRKTMERSIFLTLNGPFSISMLNYQRVVRWFPIKNLHVQWILPLKPSFQTRDYPASYVSLSEGKPPQNGQNGTVSGPWSFQACPSAIGRTSWGLSLGMFQFWRFRERRMRHTQLHMVFTSILGSWNSHWHTDSWNFMDIQDNGTKHECFVCPPEVVADNIYQRPLHHADALRRWPNWYIHYNMIWEKSPLVILLHPSPYINSP